MSYPLIGDQGMPNKVLFILVLLCKLKTVNQHYFMKINTNCGTDGTSKQIHTKIETKGHTNTDNKTNYVIGLGKYSLN